MEDINYKYKGHDISVQKAYGVNEDGYYYDEMFHLTIDNVPYIMFVIGSSYGYGQQVSSLKQVDFDYLDKRKMTDVDDFYDTEIENACFTYNEFERLYDFMLLEKANEVSYDGNLCECLVIH